MRRNMVHPSPGYGRLKAPFTPSSKTPTLDRLLKYNDDFGSKPTSATGNRHLTNSGPKVERVSATPSRSHVQPFSWQIPTESHPASYSQSQVIMGSQNSGSQPQHDGITSQSQSQGDHVGTGKGCAAASRVDELIALKQQTALMEGFNQVVAELSTIKQQGARTREERMLEVEKAVRDSLKADFQRLERTVSKALENFKPVNDLTEELMRVRNELKEARAENARTSSRVSELQAKLQSYDATQNQVFQASSVSHKTTASSLPVPHSNSTGSQRQIRQLNHAPSISVPSSTRQASPRRPPFTRACDEESETDIEESQDLLASPPRGHIHPNDTYCPPHSSGSPPRALSCSYAESEESFDNETVCVEDYLQSLKGPLAVPASQIAKDGAAREVDTASQGGGIGRTTSGRRHIDACASSSDKGTHGRTDGPSRTTTSRAFDTFDFVEDSGLEIALNPGGRKYERQYTSTKRRRR